MKQVKINGIAYNAYSANEKQDNTMPHIEIATSGATPTGDQRGIMMSFLPSQGVEVGPDVTTHWCVGQLIKIADELNAKRFGKFDSWTVESNLVCSKKCDKSFFGYNGSGIPADVRWFFGIDKLEQGEKKEFVFLFNGKEYSAYVQREKIDLARTRLFWDSSLGQALKEYDNPDSYPTAQFTQLDDNKYEIQMLGVVEKVDIDYIGVLNYLRDNAEVPYSNPEAAGLDESEKNRLLGIKEKGQAAQAEMKKMATAFGQKFALTKCAPMSWLDGSNTKTRKYLWAQLKYENYADDPTSVSIFVEKNGETSTRYRISLEIKNDGTDKKTMARYHSHLDIPLDTDAGLNYVSGSSEWGHPAVMSESQEDIKQQVLAGKIRKVQISKYVERKPDETNEYFHSEVSKAIAAIIPYYEHVLGIEKGSGRVWLITWNPANWNWTDYESLCVSTKQGKTHIEPWTCASKQPMVGDEVFLMKTGDQPRGIIAHGTVAKSSYEAPHYDPDKAAAGITAGHIDVSFDWIQNHKTEDMLAQDDLKQLFPEQTWSPMGSGIEIKSQYLPELKELWNELISKGGDSVAEVREEFDKNLILYGPPGTGKTYNSATYAVAICDGKTLDELTDYAAVMARYEELKKQHRVAFTTFHQSYGYEEFIEGIKPIVDDEKNDVGYTIEPGIFKKFCEKASEKKYSSDKLKIIKENPVVWKVSLEGSGDNLTKRDCFENGRIRIGWEKRDQSITESSECNSEKERTILMDFEYSMDIGDLVVVLRDQYSIDAIGVITGGYEWLENGGSYPRSRNVEWLAKNINEDIRELNNGKLLTSSTVYRLKVDPSEIVKLARKNNSDLGINVENNNQNYVFIIDEINRGNISKIFGELITLIENTKREGMPEAANAILPYSNESFSVPSNVYILGTMNTADRSIALMDTALRRRFQFVEMMPDADALRAIGADKVKAGDVELDVAAMLDAINERISFLYDREHTIGHAFFTGLKDDPSIEKLASIFSKSVIPLLQEYFYEDYQKIQLVLGDNGKSDDNHKFIKDIKVVAKNIFKGSVDDVIDLPEKKYEVNEDALLNILSYVEIM